MDSEVSLTEPDTAKWQCVSMMPGMTNIPEASIVVTPGGASRPLPTALILPPTTRTSVPALVPARPDQDVRPGERAARHRDDRGAAQQHAAAGARLRLAVRLDLRGDLALGGLGLAGLVGPPRFGPPRLGLLGVVLVAVAV